MSKYKVELDEDECISCNACSDAHAESFGVRDDDQKAVVKKPDTDDITDYQAAADECPTSCIHIYDVSGGAKKAITGLVGIVLSAALAGSAYSGTKNAVYEKPSTRQAIEAVYNGSTIDSLVCYKR